MSKKGYTTRVEDLGGGINTLVANTKIQNNEWVVMSNFDVEGNQIVIPKGYEKFISLSSSVSPVQEMGVVS